MDLVISYTSEDRDKLGPLLDGLHRLQQTVWYDQELSGGQAWWDTILGCIRKCDALLLALSPATLESTACEREADYARAVGKSILPVMIEPVRTELLPLSLAALQIVDFTEPNRKAAFDLMAALSQMPSPESLPDPLPDPPPVPISYLSNLNERVQAPRLDLDEQLSLIGRLRPSLARPRERDAALEIIRRFRARNDLYLVAAQELDALLASAATAPSESHAAPGYADPPREDTAARERWTRWAEKELAGKQALVPIAVDNALNQLRSGGSSGSAVEAARSGAREAENAFRERWWNWALKEFGDANLAQVGTDAAMARVLAGASSEATVAAARSAVQAQRQRPEQGRSSPEQQRTRFVAPVDGEATSALLLGIFGLFCGGALFNGLAIWLGRRSQRRIAASGGLLSGADRARWGYYLGIAGLIIWGGLILIFLIAAALSTPSTSP